MDYQSKIRKLFALLFPTGRVWQYSRGSEDREGIEDVFVDGFDNPFTDGFGIPFTSFQPEFTASTGKRLIDAKLKAFDQAYEDTINIQNSILPDNDEFDEQDAVNWERVLQIQQNITDLELRKARISRRLFYPNGVIERSHYKFIEDQIRAEGFDVYIVENRFWNGSEYEVQDPDLIATKDAELGLGNLGELELGGEIAGIDYTSIIANSVDEDIDNNFFNAPIVNPPDLGNFELGTFELGGLTSPRLSRQIQLQASFFLGGSSYPAFATVPIERKEELRQLVLKLKPLQTLCFEYIIYT